MLHHWGESWPSCRWGFRVYKNPIWTRHCGCSVPRANRQQNLNQTVQTVYQLKSPKLQMLTSPEQQPDSEVNNNSTEQGNTRDFVAEQSRRPFLLP